jgi:HEAT repeat protein
MLAYCPNCWGEITGTPTICRNCGTGVDIYSHEYEHQLVALLAKSDAVKRAQICLVLGEREKRSAVPHLLVLIATDPDPLVRVAALRALSEIGDTSVVPAITKIATTDSPPVRSIANQVLGSLKGRRAKRR